MYKKVKWLVEQDMFEEYEHQLCAAIKKNNSECILYNTDNIALQSNDILKTNLNKVISDDDIVIYHGSLNFGMRLLKETPFYPGAYLSLENYECYKYYGYYGDNLLNSKYILLGLNDVVRNKEYIFNYIFGSINNIFIRPSNGYKSFTGQCISYANFEYDFNILIKSYGGIDMNTLVLIAPPQDIKEEYRFVVVDGKIISGCLYMDDLNRQTFSAYYDRPCVDDNARLYAESMLHLYEPDKCYNMDVCKLSNGCYKLIEINSFCCGSLYGNDYDAVVSAVNNICVKDYYDVIY